MAGFYWYCFLAVVGIVITVLILYKKKNFYELISFFLSAMMAVFIVEMIVLLFLDGYSYKPGVFTDYYAENILGHIVPNATLWPAIALLAAAYPLRWYWIVLITAIFIKPPLMYHRRVSQTEHRTAARYVFGSAGLS